MTTAHNHISLNSPSALPIAESFGCVALSGGVASIAYPAAAYPASNYPAEACLPVFASNAAVAASGASLPASFASVVDFASFDLASVDSVVLAHVVATVTRRHAAKRSTNARSMTQHPTQPATKLDTQKLDALMSIWSRQIN